MIEYILTAVGILVAMLIITFGWGIGAFNTFKVGQQDVKTQLGNIKTEYQRRGDMLYNLVETVKSHKKFEKDTLTQVVAARNGNFGKSSEQAIKKMQKMDGAFSKLMLLFEQYPNLKSAQQHNKLMDEVRITEDRVNVARTDYNEIVGDYNKLVETFPRNVIANMFKFKVEIYFENEESTSSAPKIKLD